MKSIALFVATLLSVGVASCASCSAPAEPDASADAAPDAQRSDAGDGGVASTCNASWWDGGVVSDWPGYRRLTEMSPCCEADVGLDASVLPALTWIPCENGALGCVEVKRTWSVDNPAALFGVGRVSHDAQGAPLLLPLGFPISGTSGIAGFYALPSLSPIVAFRSDNGNTSEPSARCPFSELAAQSNIAILARTGVGGALVATKSSPSAFASTVSFDPIAAPGSVPGFQTSAASTSRLAFDVQPYGWIEQWPFDGGALVQSKNTTGAALLLDFLEGDDVYVFSVYGTTGWMQEYRVLPDGTVTLLRSKGNTQIESMATDGVTLAWCEASGAGTPQQQQPNVELWSAPYTNDAATLSATAKKVSALSGAVWCGGAVMFAGYYATQTESTYDTAVVVRVSDGATQTISAGPGWEFGTFALVSSTELWAVMNQRVNDAGGTFSGYAFARYTLGPWP